MCSGARAETPRRPWPAVQAAATELDSTGYCFPTPAMCSAQDSMRSRIRTGTPRKLRRSAQGRFSGADGDPRHGLLRTPECAFRTLPAAGDARCLSLPGFASALRHAVASFTTYSGTSLCRQTNLCSCMPRHRTAAAQSSCSAQHASWRLLFPRLWNVADVLRTTARACSRAASTNAASPHWLASRSLLLSCSCYLSLRGNGGAFPPSQGRRAASARSGSKGTSQASPSSPSARPPGSQLRAALAA
mmetsp:Transcript_7056/g.22636  ORF Transcript_7056/g.22636 Transcript_7056/m.22636 type:complete len:246 (-) Transcript_7056:733-1470(-)